MPQFINNPEDFGFPEDIVAIGGDLDTESLVHAYMNGVFPWPESDDQPVLWFCPNPRGILRFQNLHVSRSLRRTLKKNIYTVRFDSAFEKVIECCRTSVRKGQNGTWITPKMKSAYIDLHKAGIAHSIETYLDEELVGGVYGIFVNRTFSGESMFHRRSDASKVALVTLLHTLNKSGVTWIDTQMLTPVVEALGGELVPREAYLKLLDLNRDKPNIPWCDIQKDR